MPSDGKRVDSRKLRMDSRTNPRDSVFPTNVMKFPLLG